MQVHRASVGHCGGRWGRSASPSNRRSHPRRRWRRNKDIIEIGVVIVIAVWASNQPTSTIELVVILVVVVHVGCHDVGQQVVDSRVGRRPCDFVLSDVLKRWMPPACGRRFPGSGIVSGCQERVVETREHVRVWPCVFWRCVLKYGYRYSSDIGMT